MSSFSVTVVIPLYNKAPYIRRTLESALTQTHPADEIIIVDDGSTDHSVAAIEDLLGGRVRLVRQANAGPGPARNRGIGEAKTEWIAFLDADDVWLPQHLAALAEVAAAFPAAALIGNDFREVTSGKIDTALMHHRRHGEPRQIDYFAQSLARGRLGTSCTAVKRAIVADEGFGALYPGEDEELWARLALDHEVAVSDAVTTLYVRNTRGLMELAQDSAALSMECSPTLTMLDRRFDPAWHTAKTASVAAYRASILRRSLRQSLYHARPDVARRLVQQLEAQRVAVRPSERLLAITPALLLRLGRAVRSIAGRHGPKS